jgi:hypothetical protein
MCLNFGVRIVFVVTSAKRYRYLLTEFSSAFTFVPGRCLDLEGPSVPLRSAANQSACRMMCFVITNAPHYPEVVGAYQRRPSNKLFVRILT